MSRPGLAARATTWVLAGALNLAGITLVLVWAFAEGEPRLGDGSVSTRVGELLWFALLCGMGAFATLEILKRVLAVRGYYQRIQTRRWLADRSGRGDQAFDELLAAMGLNVQLTKERRLRGLRELSQEHRVFNLPTEQLAAQISAAADVALATKGRHYVTFLAGVTGLSLRAVHAAFSELALGELSEPELRAVDQGSFGVSQWVRAGIDQLQISLAERWRRFLQSAALSIAGIYGVVLARESVPTLAQGSQLRGTSESLFILAALIVGGMFAWILRDIAAALERTRR
jgi:hypothetical protein